MVNIYIYTPDKHTCCDERALIIEFLPSYFSSSHNLECKTSEQIDANRISLAADQYVQCSLGHAMAIGIYW